MEDILVRTYSEVLTDFGKVALVNTAVEEDGFAHYFFGLDKDPYQKINLLLILHFKNARILYSIYSREFGKIGSKKSPLGFECFEDYLRTSLSAHRELKERLAN